jgi:bacillolysin
VRSAVLSRGRLLAVAALSLALIATALPAAASSSHSAGSSGRAASWANAGADRSSDITIRRDQRGHAHYVGASAGRVVARSTDRSMSPAAAAREHLGRYAADFGISSPARDLQTASVQDLAEGKSVVRFQQTAGGLPVLGGQLVSVLDRANNLLSLTGETSTEVRSSSYSVTAGAARAAALHVTAADHGLGARGLLATTPERWLYDASLFDSAAAAGSHAVWRTEVTSRNRLDVRELVLVDGATGRVVLHVDEIERAEDRVVCDNLGLRNDDYLCDKSRYVRTETGPAGSGGVEAAFVNAGAAWDFYHGRFGVDLTTLIGSNYGDGKKIRSTVRVCPSRGNGPCPYPNAFWDGFQMVYGANFSRADDVVGHELTHGVTQHTSGLAYWYQAGAINESMSDVFGELIDQDNVGTHDASTDRWLLGEGLPFTDPVARDMMTPANFDQPDRVGGTNWSTGAADNGGVHTNSGVGNKAAYLITDGTTAEPGGTFNGQTFPGLGLTKAAEIYWGAENLMTPGSDYADLADALFASCSALIGGVAGIVAGDCDNTVTQATVATQMKALTDPSVVRNVKITGGYQLMRVQWTAPATSGAAPVNSYVLTVSPSIGGESSLVIDDFSARDVTIGGVPPGRTFAFSMVAVTSAGNSPPSPPITLRGTRASLSSNSPVPYKRRAQLTGRLTFTNGDGVAGRTVKLYRKLEGQRGFRSFRSKRTSSSGAYTFRPRQVHRAKYVVLFPANSTIMFGSLSAKVPVSVSHRVSFHADDLSVQVGHAVHFSGRIKPADRGTVTLQRRRVSETKWTTFATDTVNARGHYALAWTPRNGRDFEWRVVVKKSTAVDRGVSRTLLVQVT